MIKYYFKIGLIAFMTMCFTDLLAQKPYRKVVKARRNYVEAKKDLLIADEILMVAQVDSLVQNEKNKILLAEKLKSQQKNSKSNKKK